MRVEETNLNKEKDEAKDSKIELDIADYVRSFKLEVDEKFHNSCSNKNFVFPRKLKSK